MSEKIKKGFYPGCFVNFMPSNNKSKLNPINKWDPPEDYVDSTASSDMDDEERGFEEYMNRLDSMLDFLEQNKELFKDMISISEKNLSDLYTFLTLELGDYHEYGTIAIPMAKWEEALDKWDIYSRANDYNEALIDLGILKATGNIIQFDSRALQIIGCNCNEIWESRIENRDMLDMLLEWTKKYSKKYKYIMSYGY